MTATVAERVMQSHPLVHCITNLVTMDWMARGLLAAGARPVMVLDKSEVGAMASSATALVLNIGTWRPETHAAMLVAGRAANEAGIPVVLDPVGAGGMPVRTAAALELLAQVRVTAVRGNAGEIAGLGGHLGQTRGVDAALSQGGRAAALSAPTQVANRFGCLVIATGEIDIVTNGARTLLVQGGHPLMAQIPGAGCLGGALVAAALAVSGPTLETAAEALLWIKLAGEQAAQFSRGPGSFSEAFLDALANPGVLPRGRIAPPLAERLAVYVLVNGKTSPRVLEALLAAGVATIQFREKLLPFSAQVEIAAQFRQLCHAAGALFLINDRVDLALAVGADGVHLGQDDLPAAVARQLLGPRAIIGLTCETDEEAKGAEIAGVDYIGTGPVYATLTKSDAGEPYGPAIVKRITAATSLPVVGVGGIGIKGAAPVIAAGACGVAVVSAVLGAPDPAAAARTLLEEVQCTKGDLKV